MHVLWNIPMQHKNRIMWWRLVLETSTFQHSKACRNGASVSNHKVIKCGRICYEKTGPGIIKYNWCSVAQNIEFPPLWLCYEGQLWFMVLTKFYILQYYSFYKLSTSLSDTKCFEMKVM